MKEVLNTELPSSLKIECRDTPQSPFYVRWLNRFGGIDYWMFEKKQTLQRKHDNYKDFQQYIPDYSKATGTTYTCSKEISECIVAGAELLNSNEWYELSRIQYSPLIQWLDERKNKWIDIITDKGEMSFSTDDPAHSIEIIFLLPKVQLQF